MAYNYIPEPSQKSKLYYTLGLREAWEASCTESDGTVNLSGNTRFTNCTETDPNGNCKRVAWSSIVTEASFRVISTTLTWQLSFDPNIQNSCRYSNLY